MLQPTQGPAHLRTLLAKGGLVTAPGVYDGLSARITEEAGFSALYVSGGAIARSMGYPDMGLVTQTEMVKRLAEIRAVTSLPLIVDADTGYGNVLNIIRTVRAYERAAAVLRQQGNTALIADEIVSFAEREKIVGLPEVERLQKRFSDREG